MKKYCKALANLAIALAILLLILFVLPRVLVFFAPFVAGWIIALIASPLVRFCEEKLRLRRKAGSAFVIIVIIALIVLLLYLLGAKLVEEVAGFIGELPNLWEGLQTDFQEVGSNLSVIYDRLPEDIQDSITGLTEQIGSYVGDLFSRIGTPTIAAAGNFAKQVPSVLIGIVMALLSAYFFVAERREISAWFYRTMPPSIQKRYRMLKSGTVKAVGGYLKAQLKIEVWMYLLLLIGLTILRVEYAALIALGIALLDFLPFFGTGTVMVPWAIIKILSGDYPMAIGLLIIWGVGQLARQLIQPKIVGDSVGLAPLPTLFLLYIGYKAGGVFGMLVAVPVGLIAYTMYQEGTFETTANSVRILVAGVNSFRRLEPEDMEQVEEAKRLEAGEMEAAREAAEREAAKRENGKPDGGKAGFFGKRKERRDEKH